MTARIAEAAALLSRYQQTPYEDAAKAYMRAQIEQARKGTVREVAP